MSVDWVSVKAALVNFAKLTNVIADDRQIYWTEESKPHMQGDYLWLSISGERSIGWDDVEDVEVSDGLGGTVWASRVTGIREFTCEFTFRSRSTKGTRAARNALETIRASLNHPVRRKVLDDANVGFLSAEAIAVDMTVSGQQAQMHDARKESIASLPVRFSALSELFVSDATELAARTESIEATLQLEGVQVATITAAAQGG